MYFSIRTTDGKTYTSDRTSNDILTSDPRYPSLFADVVSTLKNMPSVTHFQAEIRGEVWFFNPTNIVSISIKDVPEEFRHFLD